MCILFKIYASKYIFSDINIQTAIPNIFPPRRPPHFLRGPSHLPRLVPPVSLPNQIPPAEQASAISKAKDLKLKILS